MKAYKTVIALLAVVTATAGFAASAKLPSTATQTEIQTAIDAAEFGETVELAAGTYSLTNQLTLKEGVTLLGSGYTNCILKSMAENPKFYRVIQMKDNATLKGVTVTGGDAYANWANGAGAGILAGTNCTISCCCVSNNTCWGSNNYGQGIRIHSGRIDHCVITDNKPSHICGNSCGGAIGYGNGDGATDGRGGELTIDTCLIARNSVGKSGATGGRGAGIFAEWSRLTLLNSTIVANTANGTGGGLYLQDARHYSWFGTIRCEIRNCLISDNTASLGTTGPEGDGAPNWYAASTNSSYIVVTGDYNLVGDDARILGGANSASGTPLYKSLLNHDYRQNYGSDAIGMAASEERAVDLNGYERPVGGEDRTVGCYEYIAALEPPSLVIGSFERELFSDENLSLHVDAVNPPAGKTLDYAWYLTNRHQTVVSETILTGQNPSGTLAAGRYSVFVAARDHSTGTVLATAAADETVLVAVRTNYVTSVSYATANFPWDSSDCAATDLVEVLSWTIDGSTVLLDSGEHLISSPATLDHDVCLKGEGRDRTTLRQTKKARTLVLDSAGAVASDMTIADCYFMGNQWVGGADVYINTGGGTVRDCRMIRGLVEENPYALAHGGSGAGVYVSSANGLIDRCIITQCTNLHSQANTYTRGGAVDLESGAMRNSLVIDNVSKVQGVVYVSRSATMDNCTIVKNEAQGSDVGAAAVYVYYDVNLGVGTARNSIMADNVAPSSTSSGAPNWSMGAAGFQNCCFVGSTSAGTSPIGDNVRFKNAAANDYPPDDRLVLLLECGIEARLDVGGLRPRSRRQAAIRQPQPRCRLLRV